MEISNKIKEVQTHLESITNNTFICGATITTVSGQKVTMLAEGNNLQEASEKAISRAQSQLGVISEDIAQPLVICENKEQAPSSYFPQTSQINAKDKYNGGGSKPASSKQQELIKKIASEKGINANEICYKNAKKSLDNISGEEAHEIITKIKQTAKS